MHSLGPFFKRNDSRPQWDDYFSLIAETVALRGDCRRRRVGAVIVKNNRIISTGYNGSLPGGPSCLKGECPRGLRTYAEVPAGDNYINCHALHAEMNAIAFANRYETEGSTLYITDEPCDMCAKLVTAAGIVRVVVQ